jgi:hypothetical protein
MAKTNYTKVEEAFDDGMQKMRVSQLQDLASLAAELGKFESSFEVNPFSKENRMLITLLKLDLKQLRNTEIFKTLGINKKDLKEKLDHPEKLSFDDWDQLRTLKFSLQDYKEKLSKETAPDANEKQVEEQRKKHINKRFNTQEKWLPLH